MLVRLQNERHEDAPFESVEYKIDENSMKDLVGRFAEFVFGRDADDALVLLATDLLAYHVQAFDDTDDDTEADRIAALLDPAIAAAVIRNMSQVGQIINEVI